ncbi:unnamed protein product [Prorocentrum cordatum]|uniref:Uncharacterized protein n=1 Tax=Prorocentrum cordatum TaxID=2364126 RepID=A0ABN9U446_9DINO|nr:unnamed protein product [Polarella glacialis]
MHIGRGAKQQGPCQANGTMLVVKNCFLEVVDIDRGVSRSKSDSHLPVRARADAAREARNDGSAGACAKADDGRVGSATGHPSRRPPRAATAPGRRAAAATSQGARLAALPASGAEAPACRCPAAPAPKASARGVGHRRARGLGAAGGRRAAGERGGAARHRHSSSGEEGPAGAADGDDVGQRSPQAAAARRSLRLALQT